MQRRTRFDEIPKISSKYFALITYRGACKHTEPSRTVDRARQGEKGLVSRTKHQTDTAFSAMVSSID